MNSVKKTINNMERDAEIYNNKLCLIQRKFRWESGIDIQIGDILLAELELELETAKKKKFIFN